MNKKHDLRNRFIWTFFLLLIVLIGQDITIPGIDPTVASEQLSKVDFIQFVSMTTGGQTAIPAILTLGMRPFMTQMIIWQVVTALDLDVVKQWSQKKTGVIQRFVTLFFAMLQGFEMVYFIRNAFLPNDPWHLGINLNVIIAWLVLVAGSMFMTWLGDFNGMHGIGSAIALIMPSIIAGIPNALRTGIGTAITTRYELTPDHIVIALLVALIFIAVIYYLYQAEMRLPVERPLIPSAYSTSYLPMRLLTAGAMPFMFSSSLFMLPRLLVNQTVGPTDAFQRWVSVWFSFQSWQGIIMYAIVVILLGFAFGYLNIQPANVAKSMKESGNYFLNVMPGDDTERFLTGHFARLSFVGNLILALIGVGPLILGRYVDGAANFSVLFSNLFILITLMDTIIQQVRALRTKDHYSIL
ncbi:preprotein translocase subunit SecY [Lacticaseibacillus brantae]|uniref:Preprotein translocase subunit SecY n=1 Tax=Lacticaseibacillus brantae DSM 23927 TaxID=1423727 RepID=A0A0R2B1H4_9LACO|nr:preprotein translocase subunit SecY [Lacticaseibacillus brantae]KRM71828.1 preprotein translocase subunit SecY [Lacticaseibacillus brantae DSM 23927]